MIQRISTTADTFLDNRVLNESFVISLAFACVPTANCVGKELFLEKFMHAHSDKKIKPNLFVHVTESSVNVIVTLDVAGFFFSPILGRYLGVIWSITKGETLKKWSGDPKPLT